MAAEIFHITDNQLQATDWDPERLVPSERGEDSSITPNVKQALQEPIGYPSLNQSITPDDRIAIAVGHGVPWACQLVTGVVEYLIENDVAPERINIVFPTQSDAEAFQSQSDSQLSEHIGIESHASDNDDCLCFTGMMKHDRPLMLNRTLHDADLLIPILAEQPANYLHAGPYDGLFPDFCDSKTQERITRVRSIAGTRTRGGDHLTERRREAREAGWMIGVPLVVRVIPGLDGKEPIVLAGEPIELEQVAKEQSQGILAVDSDRLADLVVVSLGSDPDQQTWESAAHALQVADELVGNEGAIALWTDIDQPIGKSLGRLLDNDDYDRVAHDLSEDSGSEAWAAWQILQARERGSIFFRSQLNDEIVEELGLAPLHDLEELQRLIDRRETVILVKEAQHRFVRSSVKREMASWEEEDDE